MPQVLFVAPSAYPLGGVAVWLDYLVRGLPAHGWTPTVALVSGTWHNVERYTNVYPELPWIAVDNPTGSAEGRRRALATTIRRHAPDVVVSVNIVDVYHACRRLRLEGGFNFRTSMALHGIAADLLGDLARHRGVIDGVIATNQLTGALCTELAGIEPNRVHYAPYGVAVETPGAVRQARHPASPLRIAYVGRLDDDQKRVQTIPEILRALDANGVDYHMDIVGDGPMKERLRDGLTPWIADGRATMAGTLPPEMLGERVYAQCDALLVTSSWETGPIVIWEAMAAGVPVVTSRYIGSGLENALKHNENCLMFSVGDALAAARQLEALTESGTANELAANARRLVVERYSIDRSVQAWAKALNSVAAAEPVSSETLPSAPRPAGRLDRLLGTRLAETVRRRFGIAFAHHSAGGEWPHSMGKWIESDRFLEDAARLDGT